MEPRSYLLNYGKTAEFGRFTAELPAALSRGDCVVIQSPRGLELGTVLRVAPGTESAVGQIPTLGSILRPTTLEDRCKADDLHHRCQALFAEGRRLAESLELPLEIVDTEILLDGRNAYLHYLARSRFDARPLIEGLSDRLALLVRLHNLVEENHEEDGCSSCSNHAGGGGCGNCSSGGCSSCSRGHIRETVVTEPVEAASRISLA
jgi:cell fate regulator YaaT (PSP1 superfamily)